MKARMAAVALALTVGVVLVAGSASADIHDFDRAWLQWVGSGNPSATSLQMGKLAPRLAWSYQLARGKDAMMAAAPEEGVPPEGEPMAAENPWFSDPRGFLTYHYASNRDRRRGGLDSDLNGGTVGLTFRGAGNTIVGLIYDYTHAEGHGPAQVSSNAETNSFTLLLGNNVDIVYFGSSFTFGDTAIRTRQWPRRTKVDLNTFSMAPYVGVAAYQQGPLTCTSTLTMVWRWQDFNYNRNIRSDDASDGTLVLMNRADYMMARNCVLTGIFDWNRVLQEEFTNTAPAEDPDHCWFTLGAKIRYFLAENVELYGGYTADVGNESYENHQVDMGVSISF